MVRVAIQGWTRNADSMDGLGGVPHLLILLRSQAWLRAYAFLGHRVRAAWRDSVLERYPEEQAAVWLVVKCLPPVISVVVSVGPSIVRRPCIVIVRPNAVCWISIRGHERRLPVNHLLNHLRHVHGFIEFLGCLRLLVRPWIDLKLAILMRAIEYKVCLRRLQG